MATRKRSGSKTEKDRPLRKCIACMEEESEDVTLIRPCRNCAFDYCTSCLIDMFQSAVDDNSRMPPRCCNLIQIHTIIDSLTPQDAAAYRQKFEEWATPSKTYCPFSKCSAFIPDRKLPRVSAKPELPSLQTVLTEIVDELFKSSEARFFRGDTDLVKDLPNYKKIVTTPMDLGIIRNQLRSSHYQSTADLTRDVRFIVGNSKIYNGEKHPVTKAAKRLFDRYLDETSKATDRLISSFAVPPQETLFACPKCVGAICVSCKQIAHPGSPCDTSARDHELAMLETFGYKRCPRCKAGVKKMYGCSHMQCICGAHWCYHCQRPIEQCDGACDAALGASDDEEDFDEDDYDSDENGPDEMHAGEEQLTNPPAQSVVPQATGPPTNVRPNSIQPGNTLTANIRAAQATMRDMQQRLDNMNTTVNGLADANSTNDTHNNPPAPQPTNINPDLPVNLDAGGPRRWAETNYDFGEEPDDEGGANQIWSCEHNFKSYAAPPDDGINRGDLNKMECNRCFIRVNVKKGEVQPPSKKRKKNSQSQVSNFLQAGIPFLPRYFRYAIYADTSTHLFTG